VNKNLPDIFHKLWIHMKNLSIHQMKNDLDYFMDQNLMV